ncbi:hypothetical protein BJ508DRAFT_72395 [Ascobolus immersus RN42]|uniref:Uncharacterized protein n=1 Tax=Ascobolus immersus RN42 TaxID=1160509 RepID=A0A3N4HSE1_ASCIM|nr:hypothetical protein BJ508DRAFT_72395 [Ascobolus immersus RN42]
MDSSPRLPIQPTESDAASYEAKKPIAKFHIELSSVLDPELLSLYQSPPPLDEHGKEQDWQNETLSFLYGLHFDHKYYPVPESVFEASQTFFKFAYFHLVPYCTARNLKFKSNWESHDLSGIEKSIVMKYMVPDIHGKLSKRYQAGLLRKGQIELVAAVYESMIHQWRVLMDREAREGFFEALHSGYRVLMDLVLEIRSQRLENLLLKYIAASEKADSVGVVEGIIRASRTLEDDVRRMACQDREDRDPSDWRYNYYGCRERAWVILYG